MSSKYRNLKVICVSLAICSLPSGIITYNYINYKNFKSKKDLEEELKKESALIDLKPINYFNKFQIPTRRQQIERLTKLNQHVEQIESNKKINSIEKRKQVLENEEDDKEEELDMIVIGGGATGSGICLDAQSRGLKCALFECDDFSSGTSSKSTKLIHGGIRYLESAIMNLDYKELELVKEALAERSNLLFNAPHLSRPLPILIPIYHYIDLPKFWIGTKLYDFFYPFHDIPGSHYLSKSKSLEKFPYLKDGLLGSIVYYDGQHNDARMNVGIALSAAKQGSIVLNYTKVVGILKNDKDPLKHNEVPQIQGVIVRDQLTGKEYKVKARCVINATGPFSDSIRKLDNQYVEPIVTGSSGVHIVVPSKLCPPDIGFLNPNTKDGRVLFVLPFEGKTIVGTTDEPVDISKDPSPTEKEVDFILDTISDYTKDGFSITKSDILSTWSGIRPLVKQEGVAGATTSTSKIIRSHSIRESPSGLISIVGGKWTTYRAMAEDTVDYALQKHSIFAPKFCVTPSLYLCGGKQYFSKMDEYLIQKFNLPQDIAIHLAHSYGDQSPYVAQLALDRSKDGIPKRLVEGYPYLESEIEYTVQNEYTMKPKDFLARRTRIAFLDNKKSIEALPKVVNIMASLLSWNSTQKDQEYKDTLNYLKTFQFNHDK